MDGGCSGGPDVIVPGFMKSGTTSLYRWLTARPDVAVGHKEPDFFSDDRRWSKGAAWYKQQIGDGSTGLRVDASTSYGDPMFATTAADRAAATNPDARLVVLVRDPIQRLFSHLDHEVQRGREPGHRAASPGLLGTESTYVRQSCYHAAMMPWFDRFPASSILVVAADALDDHGWTAVLDHLQLPYAAHPPQRRNTRAQKRRFSPLMARLYRVRSLRRLERRLPGAAKRLLRPLLFRSATTRPSENRSHLPTDAATLLASEYAAFEQLVETSGVRWVR